MCSCLNHLDSMNLFFNLETEENELSSCFSNPKLSTIPREKVEGGAKWRSNFGVPISALTRAALHLVNIELPHRTLQLNI